MKIKFKKITHPSFPKFFIGNLIFTSLFLPLTIRHSLFAEVSRKSITTAEGKISEIIYFDGKKEIAREDFDGLGNMIRKTGRIPDGKVYEYYPNGKVWKDWSYKNNQREGKVYVYDEMGRVSEEAQFVNGKRDGAALEYYETGRVKTEGLFKSGQLVSKKEYDENGKPKEKSTAQFNLLFPVYVLLAAALAFFIYKKLTKLFKKPAS